MQAAIAISCAFLIAFSASAQWTKDGKPLRDNSWRQQKSGFRVALLLVDEPEQWDAKWKVRAPDLDLSGIQTLRRNRPAQIVIVFAGCPENAKGYCDVVADFRTVRPDGEAVLNEKDQPFWSGKRSPAGRNIARAATGYTFAVDDSLPAGRYKVETIIKDRVKGIRFKLEREFKVE